MVQRDAGIRGFIIDLDGTVYLGHKPVPGAARFVERMRAAGCRCLFVTNRSNRLPETVCAQLREHGIACEVDDILTSSQATAVYLEKGASVYCIGEAGLSAALREAGHRFDDEQPDYVVVGFDRGFTYDKLARACSLIRAGARYVATNPDRGLKADGGVTPGTGSLVAAVTAAAGVEPVMIGKPERLIVDMALQRMGLPAEAVVMIGDNVETDIPAGARAGVRTALMLTGISSRADLAETGVEPTWILETYDELTACLEPLLPA